MYAQYARRPVPAAKREASPAINNNRGRGRPALERRSSTWPDVILVGVERSKNPGSGRFIISNWVAEKAKEDKRKAG